MIEAVVFNALRGLVSDRCYPTTFEQPPDGRLPTWPAIRYTVISSDSVVDIDGTDSAETDDTLVQIDLVAKTHGAVVTLRDQVINAMMGLDPPAVRQNSIQLYDAETKTHRIVLDYLFTASSGGGSP